MPVTITKLQSRLMRGYYQYFSKYARGKTPEQKVAWVTSFTPIEILEALGMAYYYPESYAAVIAASGKEQELISDSEQRSLNKDCCSYSCCFEGCLSLEEGPRGVPSKPDILIATNNQCNTLPGWWNIIAKRYNVPLIVIDYPGESTSRDMALPYVTAQHKKLIGVLEDLTGNKLDYSVLSEKIENSRRSIAAWDQITHLLKQKDMEPSALFDDINFLITARSKEETSVMYEMMRDSILQNPDDNGTKLPLFWLGYPLWYHESRYLSELLDGCRIVGSNYITWWNLDYTGSDCFESLFNSYNYTFLNLNQESRNNRLGDVIKDSGAKGAIVLHNKSCKCDYVSALEIPIPQAELQIDMIDRNFLDVDRAKAQIELLKETLQ